MSKSLLCGLLVLGVLASASARAGLTPVKDHLKVTTPGGWNYNRVSAETLSIGLAPAAKQGTLAPAVPLTLKNTLYSISVYTYVRDSKQSAKAQVSAAIEAVGSQARLPNVTFNDEPAPPSPKNSLYRLIWVPYSKEGLTTLLYATAGKQTVVVIEAVIAGDRKNNPTVELVKRLITQLKFKL